MNEINAQNEKTKQHLVDYKRMRQELIEKDEKIMNLGKIITEMRKEKYDANITKIKGLELDFADSTNVFSYTLSHLTNELNEIKNELNWGMNNSNDLSFPVSISIKCKQLLIQIETNKNKIQVSCFSL